MEILRIEQKFYFDGLIKKEIIPGKKFGLPFYLITKFNQDGSIQQIMEKPNLQLINLQLHVSGAHIFPGNPFQNHIDHFNFNLTIERPKLGVFGESIISAFIPLKNRNT